jgi:hypothetical protein
VPCRSVAPVRAAVLAGLLALVLCACGARAATGGSRHTARAGRAHAGAEATFEGRATSLYAHVLSQMRTRGHYSAGVWHPASLCWRCGTELGTAAAILSREPGQASFGQLAIDTFNATLTAHEQPNGSFGPPAAGDPISTEAEIVSLGEAYLELGPRLPAAVGQRWRRAIVAATEWVIPRLSFYVNGNVNLQQTLAMYIAWRVTRDPRYYREYDASWAFTLHPGSHWVGLGLHYSRVPTLASGVDGAGYLAEMDPGAPGFDPHYTILQADYAAALYVLSHQARALRLVNLLFNQLQTRTNDRTLTIQTGRGSRHPQPNVSGHLATCALPVLAFADRSHLRALALTQLSLARTDFLNYVRVNNDQDQVIGNYAVVLMALHPPA